MRGGEEKRERWRKERSNGKLASDNDEAARPRTCVSRRSVAIGLRERSARRLISRPRGIAVAGMPPKLGSAR